MSEIRQQYPNKHYAYNYKPDFVHTAKKICIELDGKNHLNSKQQKLDSKKEEALEYYGYKVYRFTNKYVLSHYKSFKEVIINILGFKIASVSEVKLVKSKQYMYDIEVQNNHNYFANSILVHNCKNPQSSQAQGIMLLDSKASKVGMTGTLLVNNPYDLFCPMTIVGLINYNKWLFEKKFVMKDEWNQVIGYQNMDELHNILYKSSIRRTKDLLDLPDKMYKQEWLELNDNEQKVFKEITEDVDYGYIDKIEPPMEMVAVITRMRQATVAAELLTTKKVGSTKFDRLNDILEEAKLNNQKVLVFCPFTQALELGLTYCKEYNPKLVKGGMGVKVQEIVDEHENTEGFSVLFAQEATLGVGYTLTNTSIVVFLSPPWSRATYDQCIDRTHRIGQKHTVQIIDLLCKDTYDELIYDKLHGKGAMSDVLIDGEELSAVQHYFKKMGIEFTKKDGHLVKTTLLDGIIKE